jgi:hypothetical protein
MVKLPPQHPPAVVYEDADGKWHCRMNGHDYGPFDLRGIAISHGHAILAAHIRRREATALPTRPRRATVKQ